MWHNLASLASFVVCLVFPAAFPAWVYDLDAVHDVGRPDVPCRAAAVRDLGHLDAAALDAVADEAILAYRGDLSDAVREAMQNEWARRRWDETTAALESLTWHAYTHSESSARSDWITLDATWDSARLHVLTLAIRLDTVQLFSEASDAIPLAQSHGTLEVPLTSGKERLAIPLRVRGPTPSRVVFEAEVLFAAAPYPLEIEIDAPQRWRGLPLTAGETTWTLDDVARRTTPVGVAEWVVTWRLAFRCAAGALESHRIAWLAAPSLAEIETALGRLFTPAVRIAPQSDTVATVTAVVASESDDPPRFLRSTAATVVERRTIDVEVHINKRDKNFERSP